MTTTTRSGTRRTQVLLLAGAILGMTGCSLDGLLKSDQVPPDLTDPAITQSAEGALTAYRGTIVQFRYAFANGPFAVGSVQPVNESFIPTAGLLSDELRQGSGTSDIDQRVLPEGSIAGDFNTVFALLQRVRGQGGQAIGLLARYAPEQTALMSHMYGLQGYAEVLLAELFCSGIPLSTLDYAGDYTVKSGSTTDDVFAHAIALFDTALALAGDSVRFRHLAEVGKARALLGLGQFGAAATEVAEIPDDFRYLVTYSAAVNANAQNFAAKNGGFPWTYSVADQEGINGLDYISANDPRIQTTFDGTNNFGLSIFRPNGYADDGSNPVVLASGVEARLIEAEAALQASDVAAWLNALNHLRQTAISPALPDTMDPGTPEARVDLLFRERAFWLFLTGHRQGDMRRLIRRYGRLPEHVYPVGQYPAQLTEFYGNEINMPIPSSEALSNPLFTSCASRGA